MSVLGFTGFGSAASLEKKEEAPAADAEDEPPKVEVTQVVEEDAFHTVRFVFMNNLPFYNIWICSINSVS